MRQETEMSFDAPRNYLVVAAGDELEAAQAVRRPNGLPDLCITSPSGEARDTAAFIVSGHYVPMISEPLLEARHPSESWDDFRDRFAMALRTVAAYDARGALVVCDEVPDAWPTPFALDGESILRRAALLEGEAPPP